MGTGLSLPSRCFWGGLWCAMGFPAGARRAWRDVTAAAAPPMRHWHLLMLLAHSVWPGPAAILLFPGPFLSFMVFIAGAVTYLPCSTNGLSSIARSQKHSPPFGASLPWSCALGRHPHVASCFCLWEWAISCPFSSSFQSLPCCWFPVRQLTPWVTGRAKGVSRARRRAVGRWPTLLCRSAVADALVRVGTGQRSEEEIRLWLHCLLQCRIAILKPVWVTKTIGINPLLCQQTDCAVWASLLPPARADWLFGELEYVQGLACGRISADFHKHSQRYILNKEHLLWHASLCSKAHCSLSRRNVRYFFK